MLRMLEPSMNPVSNINMHLKYIQLPEGLRIINDYFFRGMESLTTITPYKYGATENAIILPESLAYIGQSAFNQAFDSNIKISLIKIPANVAVLRRLAFGNLSTEIEEVQFGSSERKSILHILDNSDSYNSSTSALTNYIYNHNSKKTSKVTF